jgi:PKD repeat protein
MEVVENRIPQISSCRVVPTSGSLSTSFLFQAEATDPDQDSLSYEWDFGDGTLLSGKEASYQYNKPGVYRPKLRVQDSFKTEARCSTAWVVIE